MHPYPDSKVHGANMGPIWGQQDPGGPHVGPMNFTIWVWAEACIDVECEISTAIFNRFTYFIDILIYGTFICKDILHNRIIFTYVNSTCTMPHLHTWITFIFPLILMRHDLEYQ